MRVRPPGGSDARVSQNHRIGLRDRNAMPSSRCVVDNVSVMSTPQQPGWDAGQGPGQAPPVGYGPPSGYGPQPPGAHQPHLPYSPQAVAGYPSQPTTMPGTVRAAQVLYFVMAGLVALGMVLADDAEKAGAIAGASFPVIFGFVCALRFGKSGPVNRRTAIVFASLMIAVGFGAMGQRQPAGLVELVFGIVIVVLLAQRQSAEWFRRIRS